MLKQGAVLFALMLFALWFGVLRYGPIGAIGVVVAVNLLGRISSAVRFCRVLGIGARHLVLLRDVGKLAIASAAAGAAAVMARLVLVSHGSTPLHVLVACALVFSVVYPAIVLLLRVPRPEERDAVRRRAGVIRLRMHAWRAGSSVSS